MNSYVKDVFSYIDGICNDDNVLNVLHLSYTINTVSNNKEFCYDLDSVLSKRHTLVLSNTRELNRVFTTI